MEMMPYHAPEPRGPRPPHRGLLPSFGLGSPKQWRRRLPVLGDATLTLRELTREDAPTLFAQLTPAEVSRFISPPPTSVAGFEAFIRWTHRRRAQGRYVCFGVVPAGQPHAVGLFQIHLDAAGASTAEWGFVLGAAYWGTGVFLAGARRVVDFAFAHMGIERLEARAALPNGRGNGALRKLGAVCARVLPASFQRHGEQLDQALWIIARDHWWAALHTWPSIVH